MNNKEKFCLLKNRLKALLTTSSHPQDEIHAVVEELDTYCSALELLNDDLLSTQKSLHDTRKEYAHFYNFSPIGYCFLNREGMIVSVNDSLASLLDTPKEQLINQHFTSFVHESDLDIFYFYSLAFSSPFKKGIVNLR
jgi:PAS domain-containing protein